MKLSLVSNYVLSDKIAVGNCSRLRQTGCPTGRGKESYRVTSVNPIVEALPLALTMFE